ncbi:MAG: helix-turn-helix domain-containing protein, partial [Mycobacteriaceae bacterium]|nr:helix-turn-helix domain-containing protein [Mycobacteriaceae bacterium]
ADDGVAAAAAELQAAVLAARRAGGSVREIADELGKSTRTIQNWIRRGEQ